MMDQVMLSFSRFKNLLESNFQMGLMPENMRDMETMLYGSLEGDEELEAELLALQGGGPSPKKSPKKNAGCHFYE